MSMRFYERAGVAEWWTVILSASILMLGGGWLLAAAQINPPAAYILSITGLVGAAGASVGALRWARRLMAEADTARDTEPDDGARLSSSLQAATTVEAACDLVWREAARWMPYQTAVLWLPDAERGVIVPRCINGANAESFQMLCLEEGQGISGWVVANRRRMVDGHPELDFTLPTQHLAATFRSAASFPTGDRSDLRSGPFGAMTLYCGEAGLPSQEIQSRLAELALRLGDRVCNLLALEAARASSLSDSVTRLPKRSYLYAYTAQEMEKARRHTFPVSVVEMEIDDYADLALPNRQATEELLRDLAQTLRRQLRSGDLLARLSESEFAACFAMTSQSQVLFLIRRLRYAAESFRYVAADGEVRGVRMSFGCATFPDHGRTCEALYLRASSERLLNRKTHARAALQAAAGHGGNVIPFHA